MKLEGLQSQAGEAERLLKAMASEPRLLILCELLHGERTVSQLQGSIGIAMSAVSQHLAKLREAQVVSTRREAQTIHYSLASEAVEKLLSLLYTIYCAPKIGAASKKRKMS